MKTTYKYPLKLTDHQFIEMPAGAQILSVQFQYGILCCWALVDTDAKLISRRIEIRGTGHPIDFEVGAIRQFRDTYSFVGTVQQASASGGPVWHVFASNN